jgi:hypothetical protein
MNKSSCIPVALAFLLVLSAAVGSTTGIPESEYSPAYAEHCGRFTVAPGGGENLVDPGAGNDYRIHLTVRDKNQDPITSLAATDMWLDVPDLLVGCQPVWSQADSGTDNEGNTTFSNTIYGGVVGDASGGFDCDAMLLYVYVLGLVMNSGDPVCVAVASPDLYGSLSVTLADFVKFVTDYNCDGAGCDPCHDYNEDGTTSLADFTLFASFYNASICL